MNVEIKELNSLNWKIVERILIAFYECGALKKSQIALKSGLKYDSCMRYLKWMNEKMDFIEFKLSSDGKQIESVYLTSHGISFCKNKIFEKETVVGKISEERLFA